MTFANFPNHDCALELSHNVNRCYHETVTQWLKSQGPEAYDWENDESRNAAEATNELWILQWYPRTPVCHHCIASHSLTALLAFAAKIESEEKQPA